MLAGGNTLHFFCQDGLRRYPRLLFLRPKNNTMSTNLTLNGPSKIITLSTGPIVRLCVNSSTTTGRRGTGRSFRPISNGDRNRARGQVPTRQLRLKLTTGPVHLRPHDVITGRLTGRSTRVSGHYTSRCSDNSSHHRPLFVLRAGSSFPHPAPLPPRPSR